MLVPLQIVPTMPARTQENSPRPIRATSSLLFSGLIAAAFAFAPQAHFFNTNSAPDMWGQLTDPVHEMVSLRLPSWSMGDSIDYTPLPARSAQLNGLLDEAAQAITQKASVTGSDLGTLSAATKATRDITELSTAYQNLHKVNVVLAQTAAKSGQDAKALSKYYGLHTAMLEVAMHVHEEIYFRVRDRDLPHIEQLGYQTAQAYTEAEKLLKTTSDAGLQNQLKANMAHLIKTAEKLSIYRHALQTRMEKVNAAWTVLDARYKVALNTWRTQSLTQDAVEQIKSTDAAIQTLKDIVIPAHALLDATVRETNKKQI